MFRLTISLASLSMTRSAKGSDVTRFCPRLPDMLCPSAVNKMLNSGGPYLHAADDPAQGNRISVVAGDGATGHFVPKTS